MTSSSKNLKVKDITPEWVRENFDLSKEWKYVKHETRRIDLFFDAHKKPISVTEFVNSLTKWVRDLKKTLKVPPKATAMVVFEDDYNFDLDRIDVPRVYFSWKIPETEEETIKRLITREKRRISREKTAARKKKEKEQEEKKLLEELKQKYEE